jgi:xanthosine utilization system XapX-like protein
LVFVAPAVTGPKVIVGVGNENGADGINQPKSVFGVDEVPTANTVGFIQVKVWVKIPAETSGVTVLLNTTTGKGVWQLLFGSRATSVQVPGMAVVVHDVPLNKTVGIGTDKVLVGGKNAKLTAPPLVGNIHSVVKLTGAAQPSVKLVVLVALNVGTLVDAVTVSVLVLQQPFTLLQVCSITVPGLVGAPIETEPLVTSEGPPGNVLEL